MRKWLANALVLLVVAPLYGQVTIFNNVEARFSKGDDDRRLVNKSAVLVLDDSAQKLVVKSSQHPVDVKYGDIQEVIFDQRYKWCYFEYKKPDGSSQPYELWIDDKEWGKAIEKMKALFGDRVSVYATHEGEKIEKSTLKDADSSHDIEIDDTNHPVPELKADKALVVAVCLPMVARYSGKGNQIKLHANDKVIMVNKMGTYNFAYLDPGEYMIVSQAENAHGMKVNLEAGKDYYFLQDVHMGAWKGRTALSMHAKKVVLFELNGSRYSVWKRNE